MLVKYVVVEGKPARMSLLMIKNMRTPLLVNRLTFKFLYYSAFASNLSICTFCCTSIRDASSIIVSKTTR